MKLVKRHRTWTKTDRLNLGGQQVRWLGETRDWKDNRLAEVLTGPISGAVVWISAEEIAPETDGDGEGAAE